MVYAQIRIRLREWDINNPLGLLDTNRSSNFHQIVSDSLQHQKKKKKKKKREPVEYWTLSSLLTTE